MIKFKFIRDNLDSEEWRVVTPGTTHPFVWGLVNATFLSDYGEKASKISDFSLNDDIDEIECVILELGEFEALAERAQKETREKAPRE